MNIAFEHTAHVIANAQMDQMDLKPFCEPTLSYNATERKQKSEASPVILHVIVRRSIIGIFLWREMKRAERYEKLYGQERLKRQEAESNATPVPSVRQVNEEGGRRG